MKRNSILRLRCLSLLPLCLAVSAQVISLPQPPPQTPVSYASINQLNQLLSQLEQASQAAQVDLAKLRIEKWKTDSGSKRQAQANVESIERNLQSAMPEIIAVLGTLPRASLPPSSCIATWTHFMMSCDPWLSQLEHSVPKMSSSRWKTI